MSTTDTHPSSIPSNLRILQIPFCFTANLAPNAHIANPNATNEGTHCHSTIEATDRPTDRPAGRQTNGQVGSLPTSHHPTPIEQKQMSNRATSAGAKPPLYKVVMLGDRYEDMLVVCICIYINI